MINRNLKLYGKLSDLYDLGYTICTCSSCESNISLSSPVVVLQLEYENALLCSICIKEIQQKLNDKLNEELR